MTESVTDYRQQWEDTARDALRWRQKYEELWEAIADYRVWEPGHRGYAAARRELEHVWRGRESE